MSSEVKIETMKALILQSEAPVSSPGFGFRVGNPWGAGGGRKLGLLSMTTPQVRGLTAILTDDEDG